MFLVKSSGVFKIWANGKEDDFLQFVPQTLGVTKESLEIFFIPEELSSWLKSGKQVSFSGAGVGQRKEIIIGESGTNETLFGEPVATIPLLRWPYDENGNFLGNKLQGE